MYFHLRCTLTPPGCSRTAQVLAKGTQSEGGHVPQRTGGDNGRHGARGVRKGHAGSIQTDCQMCLQPTLSGKAHSSGKGRQSYMFHCLVAGGRESAVLLEQ